MKKIVTLIILTVLPWMSKAQSVFDKYEDFQDVSSVIVNQKAFSMLATINIDTADPEAQQYIDMAKKITGLKVFTTASESVSKDMKTTVATYLKSSQMEELMRINDGDQTVKFYVREGKDENHVKELLMFINGLKETTKAQNISVNGTPREIETILLSLTGDIDLRELSMLTSNMNVPGGKYLEKAGKK